MSQKTELEALPLKAMRGGSLRGAIKAEALAAQAAVDFIRSVGLQEYPIGTRHFRARTVDFRFVRSIEDANYPWVFNEYATSLTFSLLIIVPIPDIESAI